MKLSEVIQAAKEQNGPIRLATEPAQVMRVVDGKFYYASTDGEPVALTFEQISSNDWEWEERTWVDKHKRKKKEGE